MVLSMSVSNCVLFSIPLFFSFHFSPTLLVSCKSNVFGSGFRLTLVYVPGSRERDDALGL